MSKANSSYTTPKDIVLSLMTFVKNETKLTTDKATGNEVAKVFLHYRCAKGGCPKPIVTFADKTGFYMMNSAFAPLWGLQRQCFSFRNYPLLRLQQGANPATLVTVINLDAQINLDS